jgi:GntR family transcriptional regulator
MPAKKLLTRSLYLQLRDALAERIATGAWKPGAVIPNEGDLAREFGVSPGTMRKALDLMEAEHLVTRRQGRGTFVNDPSSKELAARYSNLRRADGGDIVDEIKSGGIIENAANELESARLQLSKGDRVFRVQRSRLHDSRAYMVEEISMPTMLFPGLADAQKSPPGVITELAGQYGLLLGKAAERISIGEASLEVAKALAIPFGSPILLLDRVVLALDGRPMEWRMGWCHIADKIYLAQMN